MNNKRESVQVLGCDGKELPIIYPVITTYTHHAHLLSILGAYKYTDAWVYGNYIQLFCKNNYMQDSWSDFYFPNSYETKPYDLCSWINVEKIAWDILDDKNGIVEFLIKAINNNCYISMMIDYYYVKKSYYYNKEHYSHEVLISGYDRKKEEFICADFLFRSQKYSIETVGFIEIEEAFENCNKTKLEFFKNKLLHLISMNENSTLVFSEQNILNHISEYYKGSIPEYWRLFSGEELENLAFGLNVYEAIIKYLKQVISTGSKYLDSRPIYLLCDHKTIMVQRMKMLLKKGSEEYHNYYQELMDEYEKLEKQLNAILIATMRYNYDNNEKYLLQGIEELNSIYLCEMKILTPLINKLESKKCIIEQSVVLGVKEN